MLCATPLMQAVSSPVSTGKSKEKDASASTPGVPSSRKVAPDVTLMVRYGFWAWPESIIEYGIAAVSTS